MSIRLVPNTVVLTKPRKALTIDELISRYTLSNEADSKSPKTITWYRDILNQFSAYLKTERYPCHLSAISLDIVRGYILYLRHRLKYQGHPYIPKQNASLSPQTIRCHVRALKAFSTWLYLEGITNENRLNTLKLPRAPAKLIEPLTPEEIKKISLSINKNSPAGSRNHAIFVIALDNGLRASELASIKLGQLNLKEGHVKVMGKGAKERFVPIGKFVQMTLWHYISQVRPRPIDSNCDNLFLSPNGKPITVNTIKLMFSRLAESSEVERLHAHLCRHTFAINYLLAGGDIFSLKEILGHTTVEMVSHYLHFTASQIATQHHKFSPMDRLQEEEQKNNGKKLVASLTS